MSKFYGELKGSRGPVTRCGTWSSGVTAHVSGWESGVYVRVKGGVEPGEVVAHIGITGGSNKPGIVSIIRLTDRDMQDLYHGSVRLELVPVIADEYESQKDALDLDHGVHYYERLGDKHELDPYKRGMKYVDAPVKPR